MQVCLALLAEDLPLLFVLNSETAVKPRFANLVADVLNSVRPEHFEFFEKETLLLIFITCDDIITEGCVCQISIKLKGNAHVRIAF